MNISARISGKIRSYKCQFQAYQFQKKIRSFRKKNCKILDDAPIVLFWEMGAFPLMLERNALFSLAFEARKYRTKFIICDGTPGICINDEFRKNSKVDEQAFLTECSKCYALHLPTLKKYNLNYSLAGEFISNTELEQCKNIMKTLSVNDMYNYEFHTVKVGEIALSSLIRFFKGKFISRLRLDAFGEQIYRKYFYAALCNTVVAQNAIKQYQPKILITSHGKYVDYEPAVLVGKKENVTTCSWASGFDPYHHFFSTYVRDAANESRLINPQKWKKIAQESLTKKQDELLDEVMESRYKRNPQYKSNTHNFVASKRLAQQLDINPRFPTVCLFAHVNWDAWHPSVYDSSNEWVVESIKTMIKQPNVNWIVRVHPIRTDSVSEGSVVSTDDVIRQFFSTLPENLKILWSDSNINTYSIFEMIDVGITATGTVGIELALLGKPCIVFDYAHYAKKSFTVDVSTKTMYVNYLKKISTINVLNMSQIKLARRYAYSYFVERQIPINIIDKAKGHWGPLMINKLNNLLPGNDKELDNLCESILNQRDVFSCNINKVQK